MVEITQSMPHIILERRTNYECKRLPSKETVLRIKEQYPPGTRVELICMDDPYSKLKPGDQGTVSFVDDIGTIHINWDCGSSLGVAYGIDVIRKL
jgi:hypothetical protein